VQLSVLYHGCLKQVLPLLLRLLLLLMCATWVICSAGYEGTFVCEPDRKKALEMYKEWRYGKKE
jgi:hypothetical protein